jgi:hypothetical protein
VVIGPRRREDPQTPALQTMQRTELSSGCPSPDL